MRTSAASSARPAATSKPSGPWSGSPRSAIGNGSSSTSPTLPCRLHTGRRAAAGQAARCLSDPGWAGDGGVWVGGSCQGYTLDRLRRKVRPRGPPGPRWRGAPGGVEQGGPSRTCGQAQWHRQQDHRRAPSREVPGGAGGGGALSRGGALLPPAGRGPGGRHRVGRGDRRHRGGPRTTRQRRLGQPPRSEEHTSELQSHHDLVCRLLLEKKKNNHQNNIKITPNHKKKER